MEPEQNTKTSYSKKLWLVVGVLVAASVMAMFAAYFLLLKSNIAGEVSHSSYQYHIAIISDETDNTFWQEVYEGAVKAGVEHGAYVEQIDDGLVDRFSMEDAINVAIYEGVDGILLRPWEDMFDSYQEALNALRHGKRNVTHIDDLIVKDNWEKQRQVMEQEVLKAVSKGVEHDVRQEAMIFASWEMKNQSSTFEEQKLQLMELLLLAKRVVQEQGGEIVQGQEGIWSLLTSQNEEELRQKFVAIMVELTQAVVIRNQEPDSIVTRAQEYILQNFRKDIALEEVAQTVGISPYYFSKLFKEETGINFSEYLTELRIETAKRLLSDREMSIKQVCVDAGYANPNYFSRIFKKWVGITPSEFRDRIYEN